MKFGRKPKLTAQQIGHARKLMRKIAKSFYFRTRHVSHPVIARSQIERLLQAARFQKSRHVPLISDDGFAQAEIVRIFLVVAGSNAAFEALGERSR